MQTSKQVETIVQSKISQVNNHRTLKHMQDALKKINAGNKIDKIYAIVGLIIFLPLAYFLSMALFF